MSAVLEFKAKCAHGWTGSPSRCKECRKEAYRASRIGAPDGRAKNLIADEHGRNCMKCGEIKSWDEFAKDVHGFNQKTADCCDCRRKKYNQAYRDNPKVRRSGIKNRPDKLKRLYGITYEHVVQTLANQLGRCANHGCGKEISLEAKGNTPNRAVIDHCHTTGKFRALLCVKCNFDLGMIETNEVRFLGLMDYKTKHNFNR